MAAARRVDARTKASRASASRPMPSRKKSTPQPPPTSSRRYPERDSAMWRHRGVGGCKLDVGVPRATRAPVQSEWTGRARRFGIHFIPPRVTSIFEAKALSASRGQTRRRARRACHARPHAPDTPLAGARGRDRRRAMARCALPDPLSPRHTPCRSLGRSEKGSKRASLPRDHPQGSCWRVTPRWCWRCSSR